MLLPSGYELYTVGDNAITISFGNTISVETNQIVIAVFHTVQQRKILGVRDIIPAYSSVTVCYDILRIREKYPSAEQFIRKELEKILSHDIQVQEEKTALINIPVCYDISLGVDLHEMAEIKQIPVEEIIRIHSSTTYRVFMTGFLPGFPYMGMVDEKIAMPRKTEPRTKVAAGSVGIADRQTGIYPLESPGGWNIIGQTPVQLFDAEKTNPVLLQAGNLVRFTPISIETFYHLKKKK
ncbi:MAG: 5-oxoprolinase subunit PxpB [Bacteroidota bacterium]|nr:5-oxoprolinase subunit PxpB [Bacteroidota bacterium]